MIILRNKEFSDKKEIEEGRTIRNAGIASAALGGTLWGGGKFMDYANNLKNVDPDVYKEAIDQGISRENKKFVKSNIKKLMNESKTITKDEAKKKAEQLLEANKDKIKEIATKRIESVRFPEGLPRAAKRTGKLVTALSVPMVAYGAYKIHKGKKSKDDTTEKK